MPMAAVPITAAVWYLRTMIEIIGTQGFQQSDAEYQHDNSKRKRRHKRHGLERPQPTGIKHSHGYERKKYAPKRVLPLGRMRLVARRDTVHYKNTRVGGRNKEDSNHQQRQHTERSGQWELLEETEQKHVRITGQGRQGPVSHILINPNGPIAKNRHP